jgi:hypothetical protein
MMVQESSSESDVDDESLALMVRKTTKRWTGAGCPCST